MLFGWLCLVDGFIITAVKRSNNQQCQAPLMDKQHKMSPVSPNIEKSAKKDYLPVER